MAVPGRLGPGRRWGDQRALRLLAETTHLIAEEAGAAVAAAIKLREDLAGRTVLLPITGGNVSAARLYEALDGDGVGPLLRTDPSPPAAGG